MSNFQPDEPVNNPKQNEASKSQVEREKKKKNSQDASKVSSKTIKQTPVEKKQQGESTQQQQVLEKPLKRKVLKRPESAHSRVEGDTSKVLLTFYLFFFLTILVHYDKIFIN